MPIIRTTKDKIPAKVGKGSRLIKESKEWKEVLSILASGLKPYEAIEVNIEVKGLKHPARNFHIQMNRHIKRLGLETSVVCFMRGTAVYISGV